ncbi:MAG: acyclic terpene utilization AtuA family protein [Pseudomonadota bacterium]
MPTRVLVPCGVLGLGFDPAALDAGVKARPDIISIDGGSTDSGPFYLGTGTSKYARGVCRRQWRALMVARAAAGVPLVMTTCGTCGVAAMVDEAYAMTRELAAELGQTLTIARLYSDQSPDQIIAAHHQSRLTPLTPAPVIDETRLAAMTHVVALAGAEQIDAALLTGADIVLAGRATDTAGIAALPLRRGEHPGGCWHGAKIGECGAFCSNEPATGVIMMTFDHDGFTVQAMAPKATCTPQSVSAHMLYENVDPFELVEPGGVLDVRAARYEALSGGRVRVEGSHWHAHEEYTVKLEGAYLAGYQTMILAMIREPRYVNEIEAWVADMLITARRDIASSLNLASEDYSLDVRLVGKNAVLGTREPAQSQPIEIGVLLMMTAKDSTTARELADVMNPYMLHHPLSAQEALPTFAFPYSPASVDRGPLYEFGLNHVLHLDDPMQAFRLKVDEVRCG